MTLFIVIITLIQMKVDAKITHDKPVTLLNTFLAYLFPTPVKTNTTMNEVLGIEMEVTPSQVIAPVGTQIPFTCKYRSQSSADLYITVESMNSHYYNETRYPGGAQTTFYYVVGCNRQTIRCILHDRYGQQVGLISVLVYPGLSQIQSQ